MDLRPRCPACQLYIERGETTVYLGPEVYHSGCVDENSNPIISTPNTCGLCGAPIRPSDRDFNNVETIGGTVFHSTCASILEGSARGGSLANSNLLEDLMNWKEDGEEQEIETFVQNSVDLASLMLKAFDKRIPDIEFHIAKYFNKYYIEKYIPAMAKSYKKWMDELMKNDFSREEALEILRLKLKDDVILSGVTRGAVKGILPDKKKGGK